MNQYINFYMNNPTKGGADGTVISTDNAENAPLAVTLDASQNESKIVKVAVRCEAGFQAEAGTTIYASGTTASKWSFALDNDYADATEAASAVFGANITINDIIDTTNTIFWAKATASSDENPGTDITVNLVCRATITPV